jgi:hypothetical protein
MKVCVCVCVEGGSVVPRPLPLLKEVLGRSMQLNKLLSHDEESDPLPLLLHRDLAAHSSVAYMYTGTALCMWHRFTGT